MDDSFRARELFDRERTFMSPAARLPFLPVAVESGAGSRFTSVGGKDFLDFHSMACVLNTGYNHPRIVEAIKKQSDRLIHCNSGYALHELAVDLAERLANLAPGSQDRRIAFGLSGSDANDGALKLVRAATGRWRVFSFRGAYHGTTFGALSLSTVSHNMRRGFGPEVPGVHTIKFPDVYRAGKTADEVVSDCLNDFASQLANSVPPDEVAAVFIEPVQGDAGILVPPQEYMDGLRRVCARHGILIVAEEVQTGIGRTGRLFASSHFDLNPDVLVLGKALGSGVPISAVIANSDLMNNWSSPGHVFSTAANPVSCAAALTTLDIMEEEGLADRAARMGRLLRTGLTDLARTYPQIGDIRGLGLMIGVDLIADMESRERAGRLAAAVTAGCLSRGLYLTFLSGNVLRLAPPLTVDEREIEQALNIMDEALADGIAGRVPDDLISQIVGW